MLDSGSLFFIFFDAFYDLFLPAFESDFFPSRHATIPFFCDRFVSARSTPSFLIAFLSVEVMIDII